LLKKLYSQAAQKDSEAKRAKDRSFGFRSGQAPHQVPKIECWRGINALLQHSIIPVLQSLLRCRELIERNEAYEAFSAAGDEKKKPSLKVRLGLDWLILDYLTDP
jgi:hypothetical protein